MEDRPQRVTVGPAKQRHLRHRAEEALGTKFIRPVGPAKGDGFMGGWEEHEQVWEICPHDDVAMERPLANVIYRSCRDCPWEDQSETS